MAIAAKIIHGDDIGMREIAGSPRFVTKLLFKFRVLGIILAQNFDRNVTIQHQIKAAINLSRAAGTNLFQQLIAIEKQMTFTSFGH